MYKVNRDLCIGCQQCIETCPAGAISMFNNKAQINPDLCRECGNCLQACPEGAIYNDTSYQEQEIIDGIPFNQKRPFSQKGIEGSPRRGLNQKKGRGNKRGPGKGRGLGRGKGKKNN